VIAGQEDPRFSHARMLDRDGRRATPELWSESSARGMVVTAHYLATAAGVSILEEGGNAMDAAAAASMALAVCESAGSGLGGMALALVHDAGAGRTLTLEAPCRAPRSATPEVVSRADRYRGYAAVAVPTHVGLVSRLLERYGTMHSARILAPAIELAEEGFPLTPMQSRLIAQYAKALRAGNAAELFLDPRGRPNPPGQQFRQPRLAATLRRLERDGLEDFYRGQIAREIGSDFETNAGFLRTDDLAGVVAPRERDPIRGTFFGDEVATLGPPAGGLALIQMLQMLEALPGETVDAGTPQGAVHLAQVIRQARRDRIRFRLRTGDEHPGEAEALLSAGYAAAGAAIIAGGEIGSEGETSHICTMDAEGNAVSMTQSIERSFGAGVATPGLGFLYNGYLRAFKVQNRRHPHYLRPGAPARSNAAPTFVVRDGRPRVVIGSTGSERMVSGILQVLARLLRQAPFEASHAPRLHCTPQGEVLWEADRFPGATKWALEKAGFRLTALDPYSFKTGGLQLLVREGSRMIGVSEPRRDGAAGGPRGRP
jgi:gamma-glutamyltranspeptidase / glutathione hydrolase